jgi:hypothetical protein
MPFNANFVRMIAVSLLVLACLVLPTAPAVAANDGGQATVQAPADGAGVVQMLIEWVEGVLGIPATPADLAVGAGTDPSG